MYQVPVYIFFEYGKSMLAMDATPFAVMVAKAYDDSQGDAEEKPTSSPSRLTMQDDKLNEPIHLYFKRY